MPSQEAKNKKKLLGWLAGERPTKEEKSEMPKIRDRDFKRLWLTAHRQRELSRFLSGEGETPLDGETRCEDPIFGDNERIGMLKTNNLV